MTQIFPCTSCSLCCRTIDKMIPNAEKLSELLKNPDLKFPFSHSNGVCEKLVENKCSVYDERPTICNISKMHNILKIETGMFMKMNALSCNELIKQAGLDDKYLINL